MSGCHSQVGLREVDSGTQDRQAPIYGPGDRALLQAYVGPMAYQEAQNWNGAVGDAWARHVDLFDRTLAPFGQAAMEQLRIRPGERVLDVGCGAGTTTMELAASAAPGEAVGVDFSAPMIHEANRRAEARGIANVRFVEADVQQADLPNTFDAAFSRLGVMFFADPVAAFASIRSRLVPGGRLAFVCFQGPAANPFIVVPLLAAAESLELPPLPGPDGTGPFSLADPDRTTAILHSAGFTGVTVEAGPDEAVYDVATTEMHDLALSMLEQNPMTAERLHTVDADQRSAAVQAVVDTLSPHRVDDEVRLAAGTWIVSALDPAT